MVKTLFATTALASLLAFSAQAQEAADPNMPAAEPPAQTEAPTTPMMPESETAEDPAAAPMPETETAEPAPTPAAPETETAQDPAAEPATPGMAPQDPSVAQTAPAPVLTPVETGTLSADQLIGANIQTPDAQNIASVDDVLMSPEGRVENVVATFGGFLGFGSNTVLLTMDEIEVMQDEAGNIVVQTSLTPEALEGRPDYVPAEN
jgi:uncharacterized protein YaaQ